MTEQLKADRTVTYSNDFRSPASIGGMSDSLMWPRSQIINQEHQFYLGNWPPKWVPFSFSDLGLAITACLTPAEHKGTGMPYASGVLTTRESFSQRYGTWTVRAKLPKAGGAFPAAWLLPNDFDLLDKEQNEWVLPEIDIFEGAKGGMYGGSPYGTTKDGIYHATAHSRYLEGDGTARGALGKRHKIVHTGLDLTAEFHDYAIDWTPDRLAFLFDGEEVHNLPTPEDMHDERHLILNFAVAGWGGAPVPADYPDSLCIESVTVLAPVDGTVPPDVLSRQADYTTRLAEKRAAAKAAKDAADAAAQAPVLPPVVGGCNPAPELTPPPPPVLPPVVPPANPAPAPEPNQPEEPEHKEDAEVVVDPSAPTPAAIKRAYAAVVKYAGWLAMSESAAASNGVDPAAMSIVVADLKARKPA